MVEDDDFLSRWSRRKRNVAAEPEAELEPVVEPLPEAAPENLDEDEEALLERLGLPVPEALKEGDDFSGFMANGVPAFLRKRALRVLWRSNPVLANLDGLNDYDDDFNSPELTQKVLATGYQVGRGFVKKVLETIEDGTEPDPEVPEEPATEVALSTEEVPETETISDDAADTFETLEYDEAETSRPRRMRFVT